MATPALGSTFAGFSTNGNIYRDGFRVDGAANYVPQQMANVQSVEVLKGAAAILYGLSEPGGIVNVITKQPLERALLCGEHAGRLPGATIARRSTPLALSTPTSRCSIG